MAIIKRQKLADLVIQEITRRISSGELKEGDKLPNQLDFSAELGVSRPSLREALHKLTLIGAIEQRPGLGTVIKSTNTALWAEQLKPPLVSDAKGSLELIDARRFIEVGIVELGVENIQPEEVQQLGALVEKMNTALKENKTKLYSKLDAEFHHQLALASHNRYMTHMFFNINNLMEQFIREAFTVVPDLLDNSMTYHRNIF
ncbi:MAG: FadR family transcriptional regulator, partial [Deltaproteobacteria bacterium]|nr:FadR family transcriptional regulator [Deltaproteobacteria bacterium]